MDVGKKNLKAEGQNLPSKGQLITLYNSREKKPLPTRVEKITLWGFQLKDGWVSQ